MSRDLNFHNIWKHRSAFKWYDQSILVNWWDFIWKICRNCETRKIQKVWYHLRGDMDNDLLLHKCSYCPPLLPPSPPFPLIPFLWPLYPSCNISSKNIPPVFCCAFHVYGKPTNFDLKFNESLLHWKNFQTITSSSTSSKVLQAIFVVAKSRTQALVGHTKCMQENKLILFHFIRRKKEKKKALYFNQKIFSVSHGNGQHHCYSQWAWFQSFIRSPNSSGSKSGTIGSVSRQSATASLSWHGLWIRFLLLARLTSVKYKQNRVLRSSRVHFFIAT